MLPIDIIQNAVEKSKVSSRKEIFVCLPFLLAITHIVIHILLMPSVVGSKCMLFILSKLSQVLDFNKLSLNII